MRHTSRTVVVAFGLALLGVACDRPASTLASGSREPVAPVEWTIVDASVREVLADAEPGTELSIWVGPSVGEAWYVRDADE